MKTLKLLQRSVMAGVCISLGGAAYLHLHNEVGSLLFAFGLMMVLYYMLPLYTGRAGFVASWRDAAELAVILAGNVIGCLAVARLLPEGYDGADIIFGRIEAGYWQCLCGAVLCGIIMTLVVRAGRDGDILPVLLGIPLFILCGFYHSVADSFYMFAVRDDLALVVDYLPYWAVIVAGNLMGCNIPRLLGYTPY